MTIIVKMIEGISAMQKLIISSKSFTDMIEKDPAAVSISEVTSSRRSSMSLEKYFLIDSIPKAPVLNDIAVIKRITANAVSKIDEIITALVRDLILLGKNARTVPGIRKNSEQKAFGESEQTKIPKTKAGIADRKTNEEPVT